MGATGNGLGRVVPFTFFIVPLLIGNSPLARAAIVYSDSFDRASLNGGSYVYSSTVTAGDGGVQLASNQLQLTNDASASANANGIVYVSTPTSGYAPGFNNVLSANGSPLTWTMNLRQSNSSPSGLGPGQFGVACVLGTSSSNIAGAGSGYAVVIGNGTSNDFLRLIHYSNGLANVGPSAFLSTVYVVSDWHNLPTHYFSVRVAYQPDTSAWTLFTRDDGTSAFADPTDPTGYTSNGSAIDTSATSIPLTHSGAYWAYMTTADQTASFDNFALEVPDTPEPATAALLAVVGALLLCRRQRASAA